MVMVEALACGTPVIAFPEGAARELVCDGQTGFLVEDERRWARQSSRAEHRRARLPGLGCRALRRDVVAAASSPPTGRRAPAKEPSRLSERTLASSTAAPSWSATVSATCGIDEGREHGFFCDDTRFLSRWILRVSETPLELLGLDQRSISRPSSF